MVCKRDSITARNETASPHRFPPRSSFLPSFLPAFFLFSLYLRYDIRQFDRATSDVRAVERKTNRISASFEFNAQRWHRLPEHATIAKAEETVHDKNSHISARTARATMSFPGPVQCTCFYYQPKMKWQIF